jgi:hypothetical protein
MMLRDTLPEYRLDIVTVVFGLLERINTVRLRLTNLQEPGFPQDKSIPVRVAAPPSNSLP